MTRCFGGVQAYWPSLANKPVHLGNLSDRQISKRRRAVVCPLWFSSEAYFYTEVSATCFVANMPMPTITHDKVDATSSSTEGEDRPTAWHRRLASTASFITVYSPRFVTLTDGNLPPAPAAAAAADAVTGG